MVQFLCLCLILVHTIFNLLLFCFITKIEATEIERSLVIVELLFLQKEEKSEAYQTL